MCWYYEDFYDEPSELDIAIEEFKKKLMKSVKDEFLTEMEQLRKENEQLQEIKNNFESIKQEYKSKERQLEWEKQRLKSSVRKEVLSELMGDRKLVMYKASTDFIKLPKCNKCDDNRKIHYKTPLGKDAFERCECDQSKEIKVPKEYILYQFEKDRWGNKMKMWYRVKKSYGEEYAVYDSSIYADKIYNESMPFEDVNYYDTLFKTREECQSYCDWFNSQKEV